LSEEFSEEILKDVSEEDDEFSTVDIMEIDNTSRGDKLYTR